MHGRQVQLVADVGSRRGNADAIEVGDDGQEKREPEHRAARARFRSSGDGPLHARIVADAHGRNNVNSRNSRRESPPPSDPVPLSALRRVVPRSNQRRLRGAADERRPGIFECHLQSRRRHLLPELHAPRDPEQPDPRARRREAVDCAHHDHLGSRLCRNDVRSKRDRVLRLAFYVGSSGSWILPGHHLLPHTLVSGA